MDELERQRELLERAMQEFARSGSLAGDSLEKVEKSTSTFNKTITKAEQALEKFGKTASGKTLKAAGDIAAGFGRSAQAARDNRESFESLNPIINSAATALSAIPIVGDALGKTLSTVGTFVTAELQKSVEAFQTLGSVGAVGASGVSGLRKSAEEAGLSFAQLSKITQSNASNLAFVFGSTATGLEQIANLTKAAEPFRQELLGLGIGLTQQTEYFADYLQVQQRLGRQQIKDTRVLAANSAAYAKNLTDLSRITGMSTDAAQAELDSQLSNIRFRRALADVDKKTGDAIQNVGLVIAGIGKDPNLTRGFQDLVAGFGTQAGTDFEIATGGIGNQIAQNLRAGAITEQQAIQQIQDALKATYEKLPAQIFGRGTPFDNVSLGMANLATAQIDYAKALQQGRDAAKTPDTATKAMTDAQMSLQRFATEVDTFVNNQVFTRATDVMQVFTKNLAGLGEKVNELASGQGASIAGPDGASLETALTGAATGAAIGSILGPIGAAVGGIVGTLAPSITFGGAKAMGGPVDANKSYLVGEQGPELMIPGASGNIISNQDIQGKLELINKNLQSTLVDGLKTAFLPGIGEVVSYQMGNITKTMLKTVDGQIEEYVKYAMPTTGVTMEAYKAGGQTFASGSYQSAMNSNTDITMQTGFQQMGGPKNTYDSAIGEANPVRDASITMNQNGQTITAGQGQDSKLQEMMGLLLQSMQQVADNTRTGADASKKLLRASTG